MNTTASKYTHIIWDWNGTLMDDAWLTNQVMNGMLSRRGLPTITPEHYAEIFDFPISDYYQRAGWDFSIIPFKTLKNESLTEYNRRILECRLREGTVEALSRVTQAELTQSVLSAAEQSMLEQWVNHYQVADYFESVNGIDNQYAAGKVDMAKKWLAESGRDPSRMLMVGDTTHDVHNAEEMGVDCMLIYSGHMSRSRLEATGARVVDRLDQIEF
jgi:phosphoglycolate phosphatase